MAKKLPAFDTPCSNSRNANLTKPNATLTFQFHENVVNLYPLLYD